MGDLSFHEACSGGGDGSMYWCPACRTASLMTMMAAPMMAVATSSGIMTAVLFSDGPPVVQPLSGRRGDRLGSVRDPELDVEALNVASAA